MDAIRLHWFWSTNPQKIRFALNELGLQYSLEFVDLRRGAQQTAAYRFIHPRAKVPALEIDGTILWESGAALLYLAQRENRLWPDENKWRAQGLNLLFLESAAFQDVAGVHYYQKLIRPRFLGLDTDQSAIDKTKPKLEILLGVLDGVLADQEWLLGELTVADIAFAPWLPYLNLGSWPRLDEWAQRLLARPAWQECLKRG